MSNYIKLKNLLVFLGIALCFISCSGQKKYNSEYNIGTIPSDSIFVNMTAREIQLDSMKNKHSVESLKQMTDGTAFIEGISKAEKQVVMDYHKARFQRYKENRSRYFMNLNVNDKKDTEHFKAIDTLTSECSCYLDGDKIRVKMGFWAFGGFTFAIDLTKNKFESTYWEDTHKLPIYKRQLTDTTLVDNILVQNKEQQLILANDLKFAVGETIFGYLTFKTKNYYRTSEYDPLTGQDHYNDDIMDKLNMEGALYFKCQVRQKTLADE